MYGADAQRAHDMEDHEPGTADAGRQMLRQSRVGAQQVILID